MDKESFRDRQIGEQIKKTISTILFNDVKDPRVKTVTLTSVKVTKDLSIARVYYRFFDNINKDDVQAGLEKSTKFIFNRLRKALRLKRIPELSFYFDETPDNADKIEAILKEINEEK